jgi:hypothetical protein
MLSNRRMELTTKLQSQVRRRQATHKVSAIRLKHKKILNMSAMALGRSREMVFKSSFTMWKQARLDGAKERLEMVVKIQSIYRYYGYCEGASLWLNQEHHKK